MAAVHLSNIPPRCTWLLDLQKLTMALLHILFIPGSKLRESPLLGECCPCGRRKEQWWTPWWLTKLLLWSGHATSHTHMAKPDISGVAVTVLPGGRREKSYALAHYLRAIEGFWVMTSILLFSKIPWKINVTLLLKWEIGRRELWRCGPQRDRELQDEEVSMRVCIQPVGHDVRCSRRCSAPSQTDWKV